MSAFVRSTVLWLGLALLATACGSAAAPAAASNASGVVGASSTGTATNPASVLPSVSTCPALASPAPASSRPAMPTPIAAFTGRNGASKVFAVVESIEAEAQRLTVIFPNSSTGGLPSGAALTARATLRVTADSLLQHVAAVAAPLSAAIDAGANRLPLGPNAPAVAAKTSVVVLSVDECKVAVRQPATVAQAAAAGSAEWVLAAPLGRSFPTGSKVILSQLMPLRLADLRAGDLLLSDHPSQFFGLAFTGAAPDFVLTRLVRVCSDDPCPPLSQ